MLNLHVQTTEFKLPKSHNCTIKQEYLIKLKTKVL